MIIDVHTHLPFHKIFPPNFLKGVAQGLVGDDIKKQEFIGRLVKANLNDNDGSGFIDLMDSCNVEKSVLLVADFGYALGEPELSLEEIFKLHHDVLKSYESRFILFLGVDPRRGRQGLELFEKYVKAGITKGLKLYPPCGFELDDAMLYPFYDICDQHDLPILSHTGPSLPSLRTERRYPGTIQKISDEYKNVKFILGHGGALNWESNLKVAKSRDNVYLDISTYQAYIKDNNELEERFKIFFNYIPDQILFGSDWPMFTLGSTLDQIIQNLENLKTISSVEKEKLFYQNTKHLLNF